MTKERKSTREAKKSPILTIQEKRAAKKSKKEAKLALGADNAMRSQTSVSGVGRR